VTFHQNPEKRLELEGPLAFTRKQAKVMVRSKGQTGLFLTRKDFFSLGYCLPEDS
jgi:hypothetical protein